jgi:hypothetical protein
MHLDGVYGQLYTFTSHLFATSDNLPDCNCYQIDMYGQLYTVKTHTGTLDKLAKLCTAIRAHHESSSNCTVLLKLYIIDCYLVLLWHQSSIIPCATQRPLCRLLS